MVLFKLIKTAFYSIESQFAILAKCYKQNATNQQLGSTLEKAE